jgi:hypothetical protein
MNPPTLNVNIEQVVREVLAELSVLTEGGRGKAEGNEQRGTKKEELPVQHSSFTVQQPPANPQAPSPNPSASSHDLSIRSRVVTMNEVLGRLNGAHRVLVSREAIVTPAVRDELIRRGVALEYTDAAANRPAPVRLATVTMGTDFDPASLVANLAREGLQSEHTALDCILAATDLLAGEVAKPDTLGLLLTRHTAAGVCLANRLPGVRAILGVDAASVATAAASVGANLLVANPQTGTFFQLKQMVTEFTRGGVRPCPQVFRARLG